MKVYLILGSLIIMSCSAVMPISENDLSNSYYVCNSGPMMGKTTIFLKDSLFHYSSRDSLLVGSGKWGLSSNGKYIILTGNDRINAINPYKDNMSKPINLKLRIRKGGNLLVNEQCDFLKKSTSIFRMNYMFEGESASPSVLRRLCVNAGFYLPEKS